MSAHEVIHRALSVEINHLVDEYLERLGAVCDSPLEIIFGAVAVFCLRNAIPDQLICCVPSDEEKHKDKTFLFMPQYPWSGYRIDWAIRINGAKRPYIFVELDGHDFHERTKEQAERDRSKDRAIQAADIPVLRFTGRELYRDPNGCVEQVFRLMFARWREKAE